MRDYGYLKKMARVRLSHGEDVGLTTQAVQWHLEFNEVPDASRVAEKLIGEVLEQLLISVL